MKLTVLKFEFSPSWQSALLLVCCVPLFIKLGLWQYQKAELKQKIQTAYQLAQNKTGQNIAQFLENPKALEHQKVKVQGVYESKYQFLLDNQVENSLPGFHILTPLKISQTEFYVLVNRGWLARGAQAGDLPAVENNSQEVAIEGAVAVPSKKIFSLEKIDQTESAELTKNWPIVWQNLDFERYQKLAPIRLLPVVIKLDPNSPSGFVRNWQMQPERIVTHLGYAYQWFGFAIAAILIFLYANTRKVSE